MKSGSRKKGKADWTKIKADYVTGSLSYRDLAKKYDISVSTLAKRARQDKWPEKRLQYQNKIGTKFEEKKAQEDVDELLRLKSSTDKLSRMLDMVLCDTGQIMRIARDIDGEPVLKVNASAVKNLTEALVNLTNVTRNLYGLPTKQEEDAQKIASARLELEQRKVDRGLADESNETGIILIPEIKIMEKDPENE